MSESKVARKVVIDTNELMNNPHIVETEEFQPVILSGVLRELEKLKKSSGERGFQARRATRAIEKNMDNVVVDPKDYVVTVSDSLEKDYEDNRILQACIDNGYGIMTNDLLLKIKAKSYNVEITESSDINEEDYTGYKIVNLKQDDIMTFYDNMWVNMYNLNPHQYLILRDEDDKTLDIFRWDGEQHLNLNLPPKKYIKDKNDLQACALDLLNNNDIPIKFIAGTYGSGKTYLATKMAVYHLDKGKFGKIMMIRNPIGQGEQIGYLKGDKEEKTAGFFKPIIQHLDGGEYKAEEMKAKGELVAEIPFYSKGISVPDSFIIVDEAEDMDKKIMKTLGTRPESDSVITFTGDWQQSESKYATDNALKLAINEVGKNSMLSGVVVLDMDVRSEASRVFAEW